MSNLPARLDLQKTPKYPFHFTRWVPDSYATSYVSESGEMIHSVAGADEMIELALMHDDERGEQIVQHLLSGLCANVCIKNMMESVYER